MPLGGSRLGAGRPKGALNRATVENKATLAELARSHTTEALETLVDVMKHGKTPSARVAAASAILDRGYGKPPAVLEIPEDVEQISWSAVYASISTEALEEMLNAVRQQPSIALPLDPLKVHKEPS